MDAVSETPTALITGTGAFLALSAGLLVALLISVLFRGVVLRLTHRTATELDDILVRHLRTPFSMSFALGGAWYALALLDLYPPIPYIGRGLLMTTAVALWTLACARIVGDLLDWASARAEQLDLINARTLPVFDFAGRAVVYGTAVYFLFLSWEIDLTGWLASAGIVGIAVGFAARDTLANLFAGVFILADAPYKLGDYLIIDGGDRGRVTEIGIRATRLLTRDDVEVIVPNAVMANARIVNQSGGPHEKFRVRATVECAYGSDIDQVREVLLACAAGVDGVAAHPAPRVRFRAFGASGLVFDLKCWAERPEIGGYVIDQVNTRIYKAFAANGIEIPYSKHDVYLHRVQDVEGA